MQTVATTEDINQRSISNDYQTTFRIATQQPPDKAGGFVVRNESPDTAQRAVIGSTGSLLAECQRHTNHIKISHLNADGQPAYPALFYRTVDITFPAKQHIYSAIENSKNIISSTCVKQDLVIMYLQEYK